MQPYVFKPLDAQAQAQVQTQPIPQKPVSGKSFTVHKDPFMLFAKHHQPRPLFTQQDLDQSYKAGYIEAKSMSLKELQQEAEFQKIESLKMIADYFPQFIQQNQENCALFCKNVLQIAQKIIAKLLAVDKEERACQAITNAFKNVIDPLCQQEYLQIRLHPQMYEKVHDSIQQLFAEKSSSVNITFLPKEDLKISQCQVHWPEGMLIVDQTALENTLQNFLDPACIGIPMPEITLKKSPSTSN